MNSIRKVEAISIAVLVGFSPWVVSCSDASPSLSAEAAAEDPDATSASDDVLTESPTVSETSLHPGPRDSMSDDGDENDSLYVGDLADSAVERFDAKTGAFLGQFVQSKSGGLRSPQGMIFRKRSGSNNDFFLVDQNIGVDFTGALLRYSGSDGAVLEALVPAAPADPLMPPPLPEPFAPRGMILKHNILYVADAGDDDRDNDPDTNDPVQGRLTRWDVDTGNFLDDLNDPGLPFNTYHPRGIVLGPDGKLYVSSFVSATGPGGHVLRFDRHTGVFLNVVIDHTRPDCDLNQPEGVVFGPDGKLYVTSLRADPMNTNLTDKILIVEISHGEGTCVDQIELDQPGGTRAFALTLLFGPEERLFVPIAGPAGANRGAVRRYDLKTKNFDDFVKPSALGGALGNPRYLTFGKTNPATLVYEL